MKFLAMKDELEKKCRIREIDIKVNHIKSLYETRLCI